MRQFPLSQATGPRTPEGKRRSRYNAATHGIFALAVLSRESEEEYHRLLNELAESLQPVGRLEELLVEKLAMLTWRLRRLLQAEAAEIEDVVVSAEQDNLEQQAAITALTAGKRGYQAHALLHQDRVAILWAVSSLKELRERIRKEGLNWERDRETLGEIYGTREVKKDSGTSTNERAEEKSSREPFGLLAERYRALANTPEEKSHADPARGSASRGKRIILDLIEEEIERLEPLGERWYFRDRAERARRAKAALVPSGDVVERLQRYEGSLERAFDRTLAQLERLQRMRLGQPVLPPVRLNLSA